MKRYLFLSLIAAATAACAARPSETAPSTGAAPAARGNQTGGATPREVVEAFLAAVRKQDVQATAALWGTADGPALGSDKMTRTQMEQRVLIMQCFLAHDASRVLNDLPSTEGKRLIRVELTNAGRARQTNFTVVQGPRSRWYVESADLDPVKEFCRNVP